MGFHPSDLLQRLRCDLTSFDVGNGVDWWTTDSRRFASQYLYEEVLTKMDSSRTQTTDDAALRKFLAVNDRMERFSLDFRFEWQAEVFGMMREEAYNFFSLSPFDFTCYSHIMDSGSLGPGVSLGSLGTDFYTKMFDSELLVYGPRSYLAYERFTKSLPIWDSAELNRRSLHGRCAHAATNKLTFVPKNDKISRVICVEPVLEMFIQLGIGRLMVTRLRDVFGIAIEGDSESNQQCVNKRLAEAGSRDQSFSTIDLSSASDCLSVALMKSWLPSSIFGLLMYHRASAATLPNGEVVSLGMISTMGNGYTFPLQTVFFSCLVKAVYRYLGIPFRRSGQGRNFGVFGDDIIVVPEAFRLVAGMLDICGFTLNAKKTFAEGPFRESCGGDYFNGHCVRPVFVKDLRTKQGRASFANLLIEWSAHNNVPLPATIEWLVRGQNFVPPHYPLDSGVRVPYFLVKDRLQYDRNGSPLVISMRSRAAKIRIEESRIVVRGKNKPRSYNPDGLLLAFLRGDVRDCTISVRSTLPMYRQHRGPCPVWDWYPDSSARFKVDWQRWKSAASQVGIWEEVSA